MMLTVVPTPRADEEVLVRTASFLTWPGWERFLLGWCAAFHLVVAALLFAWPARQVYNTGTAPVFAVASRYVWATAFTVAGVAAVVMLCRGSVLAQIACWFTVIPLGFAWVSTFVVAIVNGRGSVLALVVWTWLYVPWAVVAVRSAIRRA